MGRCPSFRSLANAGAQESSSAALCYPGLPLMRENRRGERPAARKRARQSAAYEATDSPSIPFNTSFTTAGLAFPPIAFIV